MSLYFCFSLENGITGIVKAIIEHIPYICVRTHSHTRIHTYFYEHKLDLFGKIGT